MSRAKQPSSDGTSTQMSGGVISVLATGRCLCPIRERIGPEGTPGGGGQQTAEPLYRRGERGLPWGRPALMAEDGVNHPLNLTLPCIPSCTRDTYRCAGAPRPNDCMHCNTRFRSRRSYALEKSRKAIQPGSLAISKKSSSSRWHNTLSPPHLPGRNAVWVESTTEVRC